MYKTTIRLIKAHLNKYINVFLKILFTFSTRKKYKKFRYRALK